MLNLIKKISRSINIDNIHDVIIIGNNLDGTYNVRMQDGSVKNRVVNASDQNFNIGEIVNISMVSGNRNTAKIIGISMKKTVVQKTVSV